LRRFLALRFEILKAHGYGGPVGRSPAPGEDLTNRPDQARGVVVLARRREDYRRAAWTQQRHHHESPWIHYRGGPWEIIGLHGALTGRLTDDAAASSLTVDVEGSAVVLSFWATPSSGEAVVEVGGMRREVNLYSPWPCFKRVHIDGLAPCRHQLRVSGSGRRDPRSVGTQMVFHQALAYHRGPAPARPAPSPAFPRRTPEEVEQLRRKVASRPWFHTVDLSDGIVTPGCDNSAGKVSYLGLPERLDGLSVLDVGAYDGYLSFECERRGAARVVAADHYCWTYGRSMATKDGFDICKAALGSRVEDVLIPVEEISPERVGTFDLVLFLGVLYHAPDMLRYLRVVRAVCRRQVILETEVDALDYPLPAAVFYPGDTLNHDASNNWGPNLACVEGMLREVGFRKVELICTYNMCRRPGRPFHRAVFHAFV
jgi:tRNA (mo5U34)-methyltransferase